MIQSHKSFSPPLLSLGSSPIIFYSAKVPGSVLASGQHLSAYHWRHSVPAIRGSLSVAPGMHIYVLTLTLHV